MFDVFLSLVRMNSLWALAGGEGRAGLGADVHQIFTGFKTGQRLAAWWRGQRPTQAQHRWSSVFHWEERKEKTTSIIRCEKQDSSPTVELADLQSVTHTQIHSASKTCAFWSVRPSLYKYDSVCVCVYLLSTSHCPHFVSHLSSETLLSSGWLHQRGSNCENFSWNRWQKAQDINI